MQEFREMTENQSVSEEQVDELKAEAEKAEELMSEEEQEATESTENSDGEQSTGGDDEVSRLQAELSEAKEQVLRYQAETQNALRRAERDIEKAHKFGQEKLIGELLVVVDNLERSITAAEGEEVSVDSIKEGVELTLKSLIDALKHHKVEQIDPEGEPFNPELHQAMTMVPSPDQEPNSVLNVFQKGYTLHGRLVRPAMVVVSKAPE